MQVVAHFAVRVAFYEEVDVTGRVRVADGGVWSQNGQPGSGWGSHC